MKAIIVEDEVNVREGFIKMINVFCPEVTIVDTADSVNSAIEVVNRHSFDLLFLDINLPDGSGFDILYRLQEYDFKVIFVTAYDQYAISAFKMSAVDYLLKPVAPDVLQNALKKVNDQINGPKNKELQIFQENAKAASNTKKKIVLKDIENIHLIELGNIIYCHAEGCYTTFVLVDGKSVVTSTNLKEYDEMLSQFDFIRCHHSFLININHISRISKQDGGILIMSQDLKVPMSKRKKATILEKINSTFIN